MPPSSISAPEFSVEQALRQLRRLATQINRVIKASSPAAVHDVRVAIRRFTQAIAVSRTYFSDAQLPGNRRLKKIMAAAGEVRNCDVALKFAARFRAPHAIHLRPKLQERRKESARLLLSEAKKWADKRLSVEWRAALNTIPESDETPPDLARRTLARIANDFAKQGNHASSPDASPKALHHFRIAAKKFRYALELFAPLYGPSLGPLITNIKKASALLGDVNDCVTVADLVADYKGGHQLAQRLKKRQHKKADAFRKYWQEELVDFKLPQPGPVKKPVASSQQSRRQSAA